MRSAEFCLPLIWSNVRGHVSMLTLCLSQNPGISDIYTQHSTQAIVARYAPSGFYIASGGQCSVVTQW